MKKELEELAEGMLDRLMRLAEQPERMAEVRAAFKQVAKMCAEECSAAEERCKATGSSHASLAMWADALDEQHRADGCAICANAIRALVEED